ncbi:MAG: SpoIIE family protein phosphatase [Blastocatellia bacterium]
MRAFFGRYPRLTIAGVVGFVAFALLFKVAFMRDVRPMPLSRDAISSAALDFAALEGWTSPNRFAQTVPVEGDELALVRWAAEQSGLSVPDRESLPDPGWETTVFTDPGSVRTAVVQRRFPDPILSIALTPSGRVVQYIESSSPISGMTIESGPQPQRTPPFDELNTARLFVTDSDGQRSVAGEERAQAVEIARAFFVRHAIECDGEPVSAAQRSTNDRKRLVTLFWDRPGPVGTTEQIRVIVWGDRVAAFDLDLTHPAQTRTPAGFDLPMQLLEALPLLGILAGAAIVGALMLIRRRQGELDLRSPAVLFAAIVLGSVVGMLMLIGTFGAMFGNVAGTLNVWFGLINILITAPIMMLIIGFVIAGAWAVGESQAYLVWPQQNVRPFSAWMRGNFRTKEAIEPVTVGYLAAFAALGIITMLGLISPGSHQPSVAALFALNSWPSIIAPLSTGVVTGVSLTVVGGVFAMTYVRLRTKRIWVVVLVGTLAMLSIRSSFSLSQFFPASTTVTPVVYLALTVALVVLYVRSGPLASVTAVFVYIVLINAYPLVLTGNPRHIATGGWVLVASLGFAALAVYGFVRPRAEGTAASMPTHVRRAIDRLRITQEFDVARGVQSQLLPSRAPDSPGLDVAGICVPANEVGGDYFDYFQLEDSRLGIAIGDVSGKGVGAAIYMTLTKSYMVTQAAHTADPARVLSRVNDHLRRNLARGNFVTMAYAIVDVAERRIDYARAGHNPPLLIRADGDGDFLNAPGVTLGAVASSTLDTIMRVETVETRIGDLLLLYTDGVTEAMNVRGDEYGDDRLIALARAMARTPATAKDVVDALLKDVRSFAGRAQQHDDITVVAVRFL